MKRTSIFVVTLGMALAVACQSDLSDKQHLDSIAMDSVYMEYRTVLHFNAAHIIQGLYDLEAIGTIVREETERDFCDLPESAFEGVRGGLLYQRTNCALREAALKFGKKYPGFSSLSDADQRYVIRKYDETNGALQKEELLRIFEMMQHED